NNLSVRTGLVSSILFNLVVIASYRQNKVSTDKLKVFIGFFLEGAGDFLLKKQIPGKFILRVTPDEINSPRCWRKAKSYTGQNLSV
ncbi:MAG TPA: hypothetical protein PLG24_10660, partial [Saprospiraceae bacterium]|nr:hypothetical protein [Saprospiraceae bacterium]